MVLVMCDPMYTCVVYVCVSMNLVMCDLMYTCVLSVCVSVVLVSVF